MAIELPASLRDLADLQHGVITRKQAQSAGLSRDMIQASLDSGRWQRLHTGTYATFSGRTDRQATLWAAVLRAGPGAALSFQTAGELDRLIDKPSPAIHVTIPASRRIAPIRGVVVHVRLGAAEAVHPVRLPPRTRIESTVLDLADSCDDAWDAIGWITAALGRRLTTQELLRQVLSERSRIRWRSEISAALSPDQAGLHSWLEYRYFRDVECPHNLPRRQRQSRAAQAGVVAYRDVLYDGYAVAVELDGRLAHPDESRWLDIRRDNAAAAAGTTTLRYGYRDVTLNACGVAAEVYEVLSVRGWQGPARACSPTCLVPGRRG